MDKIIFERIASARNLKGLSKADLAKACKITPTAYANIEKGEMNSISLDIAKGIAMALNENFNQLFDIDIDITEIENLKTDNNRLKSRISELEDQLNDKKELLRYYQQSYTVTEQMIILLAGDFWEKGVKANCSINLSELRNRAITKLQKDYPDLFILKPPFLLEKDPENKSILFSE